MMVDVDEVIQFHGLRPKDLRFDKDDEESLRGIISDWISQCEDMIKDYTNNDFEDEVPGTVKNVCLRLSSNMITLAIQRRDSPIIKVNDWTISTGNSNIFTEDLKEDLKPFIKEHSNFSDTVNFYAITGE